ncbi:hypothetical protein [Kineosporia sp. A_224]|uniref:hypothetical protein n=1 Tax=Kineosporia sp. A_224 TaxID=1962180 RepID=UPI000B4BDC21|nr:hypothetical protein [Kineosporia sp. A_224]
MTTTDLADRIEACDEMPYGRERILLAERLVAEADAAGDVALGVGARHVLIPSYFYGPAAEPQKIFAAFAWNLARWDEDPAAFEPVDRHSLLWYFKWVTGEVLNYPQVPFAQAEATLADMRDRYERAGEGLAPYEGSRYVQASHRYGEADPRTAEAFEAWVTLPRTGLSDCRACEPSTRVERLAALGRHEDAVAAAAPVLTDGGCEEQPQRMIDAVLGSLLATGEVARAAQEHARATRLHRRNGPQADLAAQVHACALVGRHGRGLDLLEDVLHQVETSTVPWSRMMLAAAGARLLDGLVTAGHADEPVAATRPGSRFSTPRPAAEVAADLRETALGLAAAFDDRNGTTAVSQRVAARLAAADLPDVPAWPRTRRPRLDRGAAAAATTGVADAAVGALPPAQALDDLLRLRDEVSATGAADGWDRLVAGWSALRSRVAAEAPDLLDARAADVARLDVAAVRHELTAVPDGGRPEPALRARLDAVGAALRAAGQEAEGLLVALQAHGIEALARADAGPASVEADLAEGTRLADAVAATGDAAAAAQATAELALLAVRLGQTVADPAVARSAHDGGLRAAAAAAEAFAVIDPAGLDGAQRGRYALALLVTTQRAGHEDALTLLDRALAVLPAGTRAYERAVVLDASAFRLAALDRVEEAADALDAAAADARTGGNAALAASCAARAGGLLLDLDRPGEAADRLERALAALPPTAAAWGVHADLVVALGRAGRTLDAADLAESVERLLAERPPTGDDPQEAFDAGRAAFVGALALRTLDEGAAAARLAVTSAALHALHPQSLARAEALDLAAGCTDDVPERVRLLAEAVEVAAGADDRWFAADLRRRHADAVDDADGPDAALALLAGLRADVTAADVPAEEERARTWHLAAIGHLETALLLRADRADAALAALTGVAQAYGDVGDDDNAVRVTCLHVQALHQGGRTDAAEALGRAVADQALAQGRGEHARAVGGTVARVLDESGDPEAADEVWSRYSGE